MSRNDEKIISEYIKEELYEMIKNLKEKKENEIEILLNLYNIFSEVNIKTFFIDEFYYKIFDNMINNSFFSNHSNISIKLIYFEIITRFFPFYLNNKYNVENNEKLLILILKSFLDERGLRNNNVLLRNRTSYLFKKFVKPIKNKLIKYIDTLYDYLSYFLDFNDYNDIDFFQKNEIKFFIFESFGI
jgi:hypothetical protein